MSLQVFQTLHFCIRLWPRSYSRATFEDKIWASFQHKVLGCRIRAQGTFQLGYNFYTQLDCLDMSTETLLRIKKPPIFSRFKWTRGPQILMLSRVQSSDCIDIEICNYISLKSLEDGFNRLTAANQKSFLEFQIEMRTIVDLSCYSQTIYSKSTTVKWPIQDWPNF